MITSKKNVLDGLLSGRLQATTTLISDSVVQPGLLLFRELIATKLERNENVCLVCCEIDSPRFVESLCPDGDESQLERLQILDCNLDADTDTSLSSTRKSFDAISFEVDDVAGLSKILQEVVACKEDTTIFFDSINALEIFNSSSAVLRMFRQCKQSVVALHHTYVPTSPEDGSSSLKSPLLPSLLTASGSRSSIHLTLHPCALAAHLHYVYGIENVGQSRSRYATEDEEDNIDVRVYQYLDLLHHRGWGSPLLSSEHESNNSEESYGGREYDSPSSSRVVLDLLGSSGKTAQGSGAGRCMVEYAMRGVNRSNKRSDASKIVRGLEGLKKVEESDVHDKGMRRLACTPVNEVLRIKPRMVSRKTEREDDKTSADPWASSMFNLSLTDRQREERERVELPFTRGGGEANGSGAIIIYEPDSADDLDESDPDEDLEL